MNEKTADDFFVKVEKTLVQVAHNPEMFKISGSGKIRKGFISKQTSFFYEVTTTEITILYFWDNRQEPLL